MISRRAMLAAGTATLIWPGRASAQGDRHGVGLVIGNDDYRGKLARLNNPVKDARGIAVALNACNVSVPSDAIVTNASKAEMVAAIEDFATRLKNASASEIGFLYYSGHGASKTGGGAGSNYLIAAGEYQELDGRVWERSLPLEDVIKALKDVARPYILAFDACRTVLDLPAIQDARNLADLNRYGAADFQRDSQNRATMLSAQTGAAVADLARWQGGKGTFANVRGFNVTADARSDHLLAFSSWEGQFALDGEKDDALGPYAAALSEAMKAGRRTVAEMFDDVRLAVLDQTVQQQEPMGLVRLSRVARETIIAPDGLRERGVENRKRPPLRQALVVSCSYKNQPDVQERANLETTAGDAALVEEALVQNGFEVRRKDDPTKEEFNGLLFDMISSLRTAGRSAVGLVYFAGIGSSDRRNRNYLLPMPAPPEVLPVQPDDLEPAAMSIQGIITSLELADAAGIIVLIDGGRRTRSNFGKVEEGAFAIEFGTKRVLLVHATRPGQDTQLREHKGRKGSPFAQALSEELLDQEQPRRDIAQVMSAVMEKVKAWTAGAMTPYGLSSMDRTSSADGTAPIARAPIYFRSAGGLDTF